MLNLFVPGQMSAWHNEGTRIELSADEFGYVLVMAGEDELFATVYGHQPFEFTRYGCKNIDVIQVRVIDGPKPLTSDEEAFALDVMRLAPKLANKTDEELLETLRCQRFFGSSAANKIVELAKMRADNMPERYKA